MRHPKPILVTLSLLAVFACDKSGSGGSSSPGGGGGGGVGGGAEEPDYGYEDASSPDMAAIPRALEASDMDGVQARGMTLWKMQRAMRLGDRVFASFVGVTSAKFQALASIDAAGKSGEVAFYRWDEAELEDGVAEADEALRWVVVSVTLDPDEPLDPQKLEGKPDGEQRRTLAALLVVQKKAAADHPGARWVAYTFREQQIKDGEPTGARQTRIYMIGADDKSPDIEYTVLDPAKRKQPPQIIDEVLQLAGDATSKLPLTTPAQSPGPSTIARAVAIATVTSKPVEIVDAAGNKWSVAPKTGALTRK
ncbi:MAG TPA: hypothetical protein VK034_09425 [Enhygromyxa sp.]|nr:hypothetical protein [Enhygromyxa sp.]